MWGNCDVRFTMQSPGLVQSYRPWRSGMARKTNLDEAMEAEMEGVEDSDESEEEMEGNRG